MILAAFLPNYAFSMDEGMIVVSLTDRFWANDPERLFNLLVHERFYNSFARYQSGISPNEAKDGQALIRALLWQVQNEGMATYVTYRAKQPRPDLADYRLLETPEEVRKRFALCRRLISDLRDADEEAFPALRERLWREGNVSRMTDIVGAWMAQRIEQQKGARTHPDAKGRYFLGDGFRKSPNSPFGGMVARTAGTGQPTADGGYLKDAPAPLLSHDREGGAGHINDAVEVRIDQRLESLRIQRVFEKLISVSVIQNQSLRRHWGVANPYPTDLTDAAWALVSPLLPPPLTGGRRRTTDLRGVLDAIFYFVADGLPVAPASSRVPGMGHCVSLLPNMEECGGVGLHPLSDL